MSGTIVEDVASNCLFNLIYWPISLTHTGTAYRLLPKVLANRLGDVLARLIDPARSQSRKD
jgi:hypothetical protein